MIDAKSFARFSSLSKCGIDLPKTWNFSLTYYMIKKTIEVLKCEPICWVSSAYSPWRMRTSIWNVVWMRTGLSGRDITDTEQCDTVKQKSDKVLPYCLYNRWQRRLKSNYVKRPPCLIIITSIEQLTNWVTIPGQMSRKEYDLWVIF